MILINGVSGGTLPATDRGLAYGDGVFRTFPLRDGRPPHWSRHYAKLRRDCSALGMPCPERATLDSDLESVGRALPDCAVKVIVTRGTGERGYRPPLRVEPTRIVMSSPLPDHAGDRVTAGVRVRRCALRMSRQPALAGVKHLNRLENVLARAEWSDAEIAEGVMCDESGLVIGGTMSNLFIVEKDILVTPDLSKCGVAGVTRERVIEACRGARVVCRIEPVEWSRLAAADEVLLVNSLIGLWPVRELDGAVRPVGPMAHRVRQWLNAECSENT